MSKERQESEAVKGAEIKPNPPFSRPTASGLKIWGKNAGKENQKQRKRLFKEYSDRNQSPMTSIISANFD